MTQKTLNECLICFSLLSTRATLNLPETAQPNYPPVRLRVSRVDDKLKHIGHSVSNYCEVERSLSRQWRVCHITIPRPLAPQSPVEHESAQE
jgi:hypothetical protein